MNPQGTAIITAARTKLGSLITSHIATVWALIGFVYNKLPVIALLAFMTYKYIALTNSPEEIESGMPFIELLYGAIIVGCIGVVGPFLRLLLFPEVAKYAESGQLGQDLSGAAESRLRSATPALTHYWFATAVCYLVPMIAMFGAMHLGK